MEELLSKNYYLITHCVEILAAVTGLIFYKKYKSTAAKYFVYFLIYTVFCELIGRYTNFINDDGFFSFLKGTIFEKNHWLFNITWFTGAIVFYTFYYSKNLKLKRDKAIVKYIGIIFFIFSILYISYHHKEFFVVSFPVINVIGAIVIVVCTVLYFTQILRSEKILTFYKSLNFYISSTILIWWLITTPLVFYDIYFGLRDSSFVILKWKIYLLSNIFMYSMFTFALIFSNPEND